MCDSFIPIPNGSDFGFDNLPYGIFSTRSDPRPRVGVAIGEHVLDVHEMCKEGLLCGPNMSTASECLKQSTLNEFMAMGRPVWLETRQILQRLLSSSEGALRDNVRLRSSAIHLQEDVRMHLPARIGNYTDFYCSKEHATNCGAMFRGAANLLQPNWLHLPIAYHGRASSIVISGTDVKRPWGQVIKRSVEPNNESKQEIVFQPSTVADFELEMGCFIGPGTELGNPVPIDNAESHMFGFVLVNDWSARDIQKWEYVPLGPFASKNWATSISPWVVTLEALEPYKIPAPEQEPPALPYLTPSQGRYNYGVSLEAIVKPASCRGAESSGKSARIESDEIENRNCSNVITKSSMETLYWTVPQMIAHHTAGGCNLQTGDLIATGTLSQKGERGQGCMLELSWNGTREIKLSNGQMRTFLEDGDEVVLRGQCRLQPDNGTNVHPKKNVGFGICTGRLLPSIDR